MTESTWAPWLYLAFSLWCAWFSYNAHFPMKSESRRATLSFAAGWLTTELALHHIAWQLVATGVFFLLGAFERWPGFVGLGISGLSWAALLVSQRQAMRARKVCEEALAKTFGHDYFEKIRPTTACTTS